MVLGYGDSIAYDQLVEHAGHRPDKTTVSPLVAPAADRRPDALRGLDVTHLRDVFAALDADLKKRGRSDWVSEEMEVDSPKTYDFHGARLGAAEDAGA